MRGEALILENCQPFTLTSNLITQEIMLSLGILSVSVALLLLNMASNLDWALLVWKIYSCWCPSSDQSELQGSQDIKNQNFKIFLKSEWCLGLYASGHSNITYSSNLHFGGQFCLWFRTLDGVMVAKYLPKVRVVVFNVVYTM